MARVRYVVHRIQQNYWKNICWRVYRLKKNHDTTNPKFVWIYLFCYWRKNNKNEQTRLVLFWFFFVKIGNLLLVPVSKIKKLAKNLVKLLLFWNWNVVLYKEFWPRCGFSGLEGMFLLCIVIIIVSPMFGSLQRSICTVSYET